MYQIMQVPIQINHQLFLLINLPKWHQNCINANAKTYRLHIKFYDNYISFLLHNSKPICRIAMLY